MSTGNVMSSLSTTKEQTTAPQNFNAIWYSNKCKLSIKYSPLSRESKSTLTWITLLYFTISPNSFLFSDSFCFCSNSAACYKMIIKYSVRKHCKQDAITDKEIRGFLGTRSTKDATMNKTGWLLYSWCLG